MRNDNTRWTSKTEENTKRNIIPIKNVIEVKTIQRRRIGIGLNLIDVKTILAFSTIKVTVYN
jgi:hypothetical protein